MKALLSIGLLLVLISVVSSGFEKSYYSEIEKKLNNAVSEEYKTTGNEDSVNIVDSFLLLTFILKDKSDINKLMDGYKKHLKNQEISWINNIFEVSDITHFDFDFTLGGNSSPYDKEGSAYYFTSIKDESKGIVFVGIYNFKFKLVKNCRIGFDDCTFGGVKSEVGGPYSANSDLYEEIRNTVEIYAADSIKYKFFRGFQNN